MKIVYLVTAMAVLMISAHAQDAKVSTAVPVPNSPAVSSERPLSEVELLKLQLSMANVKLLQDKYKLAEYQREVQPEGDKQEKIVTEICLSIGVPADKIKTDCGLQTGLDAEGKPVLGQDGKPVPAKAWKVVAAPPPVSDPKK